MYISSGVHLQESWYKVAICIYHQSFICRKIDVKLRYVYILYYHVFILRKVYIKLRNAYIIKCSPTGKLIKAAARLYYHVFICRNVNIYICGLHISSGVHRRESWYKVSVCIYYHVFVCKKVDIKLRYVYIIRCSSAGKMI